MKINKFMLKNKNKHNIFRIEAEKITKLENEKIHTQTILDIFEKTCIPPTTEHTDTYLGHNEFHDLVFFNIWELEDCEKSIIKELKKINIHSVEHIDFIKNEINKRKNNIIKHEAFNLFELFSVIHLINKSSRLINEDWSLNKDSVKSFVYWYASEIDSEDQLSKKHSNILECINSKTSINNETSYFKIYKKYLEISFGQHSDYKYNIPFENLIQRGFYFATVINNGIQQKRAEGLLFDLVFQFKNKELNIEEVFYKINNILKQEIDFHSKENISHYKDISHSKKFKVTPPKLLKSSHKCFYIPPSDSCTLHIGFHENIKKNIIGFKKRKINEYESIKYQENILTIGSDYTSVALSDLTLLAQEIYRSNSIIYLNNRNQSDFIDMVNNIAKIDDRINDVLHLNLDNAEKFLKPDKIVDILNSSKIVLIDLPDLEKVDNELRERINYLHMILFNTIINEKDKILNKNSLYINHLNHLSNESLYLLKDLLNQVDNDKFNCRFSCFDLTWRKDNRPILLEILNNNITYCKIMKCYDPTETFEYFSVNDNNIHFRVSSIDLKNLNYNEFFLAKKLSIYPKRFKSFFYNHDNNLNGFTNQTIYN